jgi:thiol-disulfide isomerase/thioredoxin
MKLPAFALILASLAPAFVSAQTPRKSPEFTITEAPGKETLLSSYRGKVVVLAFVHTTCVHCQAFSAMIARVHKDLGPRGFQPIDVAWNTNAQALVPGFVKQLQLDFPVGYSEWEPIMSYLGFSVMDRPVVPLVVVIDRKGMIRAQSPPQGDPNLQDETKLRPMIEGLLSEGSATSKAVKSKR